MGSDAFRSLFTLYQSKTRVSTHVEMVSNSLMVDSEDTKGVGADDHQKYIFQVCKTKLAPTLMPPFSCSHLAIMFHVIKPCLGYHHISVWMNRTC